MQQFSLGVINVVCLMQDQLLPVRLVTWGAGVQGYMQIEFHESGNFVRQLCCSVDYSRRSSGHLQQRNNNNKAAEAGVMQVQYSVNSLYIFI